MAITSMSQTRTGSVTTVTVVSDLSGVIFYHWYIDGAFIAATQAPSRSFRLSSDERVRIEVLDTTDPDFDSIANAPAGYPATRSLVWQRCVDEDVAAYVVEQRIAEQEYVEIGTIYQTAGGWSFALRTPRLLDLTAYQWRVRPRDRAGNLGTALVSPEETVVRTPDAPDFTATFNVSPRTVTFTEAA